MKAVEAERLNAKCGSGRPLLGKQTQSRDTPHALMHLLPYVGAGQASNQHHLVFLHTLVTFNNIGMLHPCTCLVVGSKRGSLQAADKRIDFPRLARA